ncbi:MAG: FAD:protein FMN transferase [Candidatus Omnitrophota bacterium]|nr:FAD:protein FMN transferase [Candidatus Omnitrophota bacterium]
MKKIRPIVIIIMVVFAGLWVIRSYNGRRFHVEKETRFMMDTYVTIYAVGPKAVASKAMELALNRMQEIDIKFNSLNPKSPVYAFNHTGEPISDNEIISLVQTALVISEESGGAFDISIAPLAELWGFYSKEYYLPRQEEIKDCLANVGYHYLSLDKGKLTKDNMAVRIDLGGVAKGYAINEAIKVLKSNGVTSALIDAGGDVYGLGKRGSRSWKVGIKDPRGEGTLGYVEVEDLAVMGSGDYERFFIKDGKRYHHIFNPKTGYPTEGVQSVILIYNDPVLAQAWTKIPFIMGPEKGLERLEKIPNMDVIIITESGETLYSSGLKHSLNFIK